MKRILIACMLVSTVSATYAQSAGKANDLLKQKKVEEAKAEIDKVMANEKNAKEADAWYAKSKVYDAVSSDAKLGAANPNAKSEAFEALKRYVELDTKKLISLTIDNYGVPQDLYRSYFQSGATFYNNTNYADAYTSFKNCLEVSQYMHSKGWTNVALDTTVVLYTGVSAEKLNKKEDAALYYGKLADAKVSMENMVDIYKWLTDYYYQKKDAANAEKYLTLGESIYPKDAFWSAMKLDMARDKGDKQVLFTKYEDIISKDPSNYLYVYNYGIELYKEAYKEDAAQRPANSPELIEKAATNLKKALELKPDYAPANLVVGQLLYNQGVDMNAQMKMIKTPATGKLKPEDQKKKDDLKAGMLKKFDESIPYFEKVDQILGSQGKLKGEEKTNLKDAYDLLTTIYEQKNMKDKSKVYEEKFNNVDKTH